jgi:CTP:molybdopterin cytidylyltransferase MocA
VKDVAAIVLAAGRSRRMGEFKPLLPFGDRTVIEACVTNFLKAGIEQVVVITGHRGADVRAQLDGYPVRFVTNPDPDSEMSNSIALGVKQVDTAARAVLISPADFPAVPAGIIEMLVAEWRRTGHRLIQPEHEQRGGHPVLVDLAYRSELTKLDPASGLRSFFDQHRGECLRIPVSSPFVARDMDTWEDYSELHLAVFGRTPPDVEPDQELSPATNGNPPKLI